MKMLKILSAVLCLATLTVLMAACAVQDSITPCYIDERVGEYTNADMTSLVPYTTIADAKRLGREMNFVSAEKREALLQEVKKNSRLHAFLADALSDNLIDANSLRETLFAPTGVYGALTGLLGLGAGALFIKRPGDLRKEDVEDA
jgi:hypothetical protein